MMKGDLIGLSFYLPLINFIMARALRGNHRDEKWEWRALRLSLRLRLRLRLWRRLSLGISPGISLSTGLSLSLSLSVAWRVSKCICKRSAGGGPQREK